MGNLATAYVIYNGTDGSFVGDQNQNTTIQINCDRLRAYSPRPCWLKRNLFAGDGTQIRYQLTFNGSDPEFDQNTLQGYFIENDGQDTMIDVVSWQALVEACNCGDCAAQNGNVIARYYAYGWPNFSPLTGNTYCLTRADDGSGYAHDVAVTDYQNQYYGNMRLKSNLSGISTYVFSSFYTISQLTPIGTDSIAACGG